MSRRHTLGVVLRNMLVALAFSTPASAQTSTTSAITEFVMQSGESGMMIPIAVTVVVLVGVGGGAVWYSKMRADGSRSATTEDASTPPEPTIEEEHAVDSGVPESELLSDEDRVIQLLETNGGRMRQVTIVEETDWSKSKVSMLLSDMEEDGDISKLRVGRENIISLAGEEPEAAGSPFEDE